jgi:hypothetical protein
MKKKSKPIVPDPEEEENVVISPTEQEPPDLKGKNVEEVNRGPIRFRYVDAVAHEESLLAQSKNPNEYTYGAVGEGRRRRRVRLIEEDTS